MKTTTTKLMIATALLALATGVASAQALQANIPFAFRVGNKVMAPGNYRVSVQADRLVILSNYEARSTALLTPTSTGDPAKAWKAKGDPVMSFECGVSRCELNQIWTGDSAALHFSHRSLGPEQRAAITEIRMVRATE
jgi:hypothetical protein